MSSKISVKQALLSVIERLTKDSPDFTRKQILEHIEEIRALTESKGKTLNQTISRELQSIRDVGKIEFVSAGKYRVVTVSPFPTDTAAGGDIDEDPASESDESSSGESESEPVSIIEEDPEMMVKLSEKQYNLKQNYGYIYCIRANGIHAEGVYKCGRTQSNMKKLYERYRTDFGKNMTIYRLYKVFDYITAEKLLFELGYRYRIEPNSEYLRVETFDIIDEIFDLIALEIRHDMVNYDEVSVIKEE